MDALALTRPAPHPLLAAAFTALDAAGGPWCVLRGADTLAAPPHDVDLLVAPETLRRARAALAAAGFAPLPLNSRHLMLVAYDEAGDGWLTLDVVAELVYGRGGRALRLPLADRCLARRVRVDDVPVPDPGDAYWTELLHELLDRDAVRPAHGERLSHGAEAPAAAASAIGAAVGDRAAIRPETLLALAAAGEWDALRRLLPTEEPRHRPFARALRRSRAAAKRRGVSVAVVGPDGAGKSTLVAGLEASFPLPARHFYMGMQAGTSEPGKTWSPPSGAPRPSRRPLPLRLARQWRRLARLSRRSLLAWLELRRGRLVVFDRYPYDAAVNWERTRGLGVRCRRFLLDRAVGRPDVVVVLNVPGAVSFARKREHSPELLEQRRDRYLALAEGLDQAAVVDATRPATDVRRTVTGLVWRTYAARASG